MAMSSHDVLFEIFSWLPAKVVYRFKSVGKFSLEFSDETLFASKQAQNALLKDDTCFFIQSDIGQRYNGQTELHPLPGEELSSGVSDDVLQFLTNSARIVASSNGLILCRATCQNQVELFICNPATQSLSPIPIPEDLQVSVDADLKIVFECHSDDCMLFLFCENPKDGWSSNLYCNVYLHKEGVWKAREESFTTGARNLRFDIPVIHNGAIHFISDCSPYVNRNSQYFWPYIMSYNLESGASRMLRVPKKARRGFNDDSCNMGIFKWGKVTSSTKSICLVRLRKFVFTIWALRDYESSSWRMILKIRVKAMGLVEQDPTVTGFTVLNGDLLVFATTKKVYGYGLSNENCIVLEEICEHGCETGVCFTSYSNTLRTCGTDATALPPKKKMLQPISPTWK
ncbi:F-box protein At5g07610-like [Gastrolobium bilobum]|uniref:F-box protein At5g07610-like n=1 Tax=Gastrolobium bilobum TaxID=150636 RepID=UPI002AB1C1A0|nr:F-box protein At5g07610-like [Gastrolobium bilobum]